ncbi:MAG TPA: hypothetical protein VD866_04665 [Urbifossiella sp.]|nr:hypothetical protein [Urbifossiella sp.]
MSRVFSAALVLRQTSHAVTRQLLARLGHPDLPVPWDGLHERDVDPVLDAVRALPRAAQDDFEGALRTVFDLASAAGVAAIREAAGLGEDALPPDAPHDGSVYDLAAWAWVHLPRAVEVATLFHQVDHLAWWRRRDDLPRGEPDASPEALARLGTELAALLEAEQGRGRRCTVEPLARGPTRYFFAYPDDYVQNVTAHDDGGRLTPRTFRRTFAVVFALDPAAGTLELYARLSARLKQRVEEVFARAVLGAEVGPWARPAYHLARLRWRETALPTDPADRVRVSVRQLRLRVRGTQRVLTVKGDPDLGPDDVYDMLDDLLDRERVPLASLDVTLVGFCFEFLDAPPGRGRTLTFEVAAPNTCSLRNQRPERVELALEYLRRWGICVDRPADPGVGAA